MQIIDGLINAGQKPSSDFRYNEDWMAVGKNYAAVFDGATFKGQSSVAKDGFTDATWCAQTAAQIFSSIIKRTTNPQTIYYEICKKLSRDFSSIARINPLELSYGQRPSTTFSCATQIGQTIRIIQIGDSPVFVKLKNGAIETFYGDPVLLNQDDDIRKDIANLWNNNPNSNLKEIIQMRTTPSIRHVMNKSGGYGVLTVVEPESLNFVTKDYDARDVEKILLFTDGLAEVYDTFDIVTSPHDLFKQIEKPNGLRVITHMLREYQILDKNCKKHPRPKISDDVTAIIVKPSF